MAYLIQFLICSQRTLSLELFRLQETTDTGYSVLSDRNRVAPVRVFGFKTSIQSEAGTGALSKQIITAMRRTTSQSEPRRSEVRPPTMRSFTPQGDPPGSARRPSASGGGSQFRATIGGGIPRPSASIRESRVGGNSS